MAQLDQVPMPVEKQNTQADVASARAGLMKSIKKEVEEKTAKAHRDSFVEKTKDEMSVFLVKTLLDVEGIIRLAREEGLQCIPKTFSYIFAMYPKIK